ncbi:MAG: AbrB/MazE/SpoVT family DNA-binding domain-containing protein [Acidobacteria bacterium]|nr:AbrB/MazE/SpoVT family DNA-binding domain-containing protein [Acidobacteriota bacterium]
MPAAKTVRIRVREKRQITLPRDLDVNAGDELEARIYHNRVELVPVVSIPRDQAWFWTKEWQAKEREADQALAAGDYSEFSDVEDLIAALKK